MVIARVLPTKIIELVFPPYYRFSIAFSHLFYIVVYQLTMVNAVPLSTEKTRIFEIN